MLADEFWLCPSVQYAVIQGHMMAPCESLMMVEIHHYERLDSAAKVELIVSHGQHESAHSLWGRVVARLVEHKRETPYNPSACDHGKCVLHIGSLGPNVLERVSSHVLEQVEYMNLRHRLLWLARPDRPRHFRVEAKAMLAKIVEHGGRGLPHMLAWIDTIRLQKLLPARDYERLIAVAEHERVRTGVDHCKRPANTPSKSQH